MLILKEEHIEINDWLVFQMESSRQLRKLKCISPSLQPVPGWHWVCFLHYVAQLWNCPPVEAVENPMIICKACLMDCVSENLSCILFRYSYSRVVWNLHSLIMCDNLNIFVRYFKAWDRLSWSEYGDNITKLVGSIPHGPYICDLDWIILVGPFQFRIFCASVVLLKISQ